MLSPGSAPPKWNVSNGKTSTGKKKLIEISALSSKTASRRFVTMRPNLLAWLAPYRTRAYGKVCPDRLHLRLKDGRKRAGLEHWPPNALRHSFGSYHLAHFRSAAETALEIGGCERRHDFSQLPRVGHSRRGGTLLENHFRC